MNKYKVNGAVFRINAVELGLSKAQAGPRMRALTQTGEGTYRANGPVEFKSGEMIGIAPEDVPKNFMAFLDLIEESPAAVKARKAKAKGAADKTAAEEAAARNAAGGAN